MGVPEQYTQLIDSIVAARPTAWVISCGTARVSGQTSWPEWDALYNAAKNQAATSASDRVVFADVGAVLLGAGDFYDSTHWTKAGADKVGAVIANAIKEIASPTTPPPPPTRGIRQSKLHSVHDWDVLPTAGDVQLSFDSPVAQGSTVVVCASLWNDQAGTGTGGGTSNSGTELINSMYPQGDSEIPLHGVQAGWGSYWPEFQTVYNYTQQYWPPDKLWVGRETELVFWGVIWEAAGNTAFGSPYTENPHNKKVVPHVRNWRAFAYYSDTNAWELVVAPTGIGWHSIYDGYINPNTEVPPDPANYQTFSDGAFGYTPWNETGDDSPADVQCFHFAANGTYYIRDTRKQYLVCIAQVYECRVEPHVVRGGTQADVDGSTYIAHTGIDPYPYDFSGYDSRLDAKIALSGADAWAGLYAGRMKYITGEWQSFAGYVMQGPGGNSTSGTREWMQAHPIPTALLGDSTGQTTADLIIAGCTDNHNNGQYNVVANVEDGAGANVFSSIHYKDNVQSSGGAFTVNVDFALDSNNVGSITLLEITGIQAGTDGSLDVFTPAAIGPSTSPSVALPALSTVDEIIVGVFSSADPPTPVITNPPGFSSVQGQDNPVTTRVIAKTATSTDAQTVTWTLSAPHPTSAVVAAFRFNPSTVLTGSASITLPTPATVATGKVTVRGSLAKTLGAATAAGSSGAVLNGSLLQTLQYVMSYSTGQVRVTGGLARTLMAALASGSSISTLYGDANLFLSSILGVAEGRVTVRGNGAVTLRSAASSSIGEVASPSVYIPPIFDVQTAGWGSTDPGSLYDAVNESQPNDLDYVYSTNQQPVEFLLQPVDDPYQSTGHSVRYRVRSQYGHGVIVRLVQGNTVIAEWVHQTLPDDFTTYVQTLTLEQADTITNYADLRIRIYAL